MDTSYSHVYWSLSLDAGTYLVSYPGTEHVLVTLRNGEAGTASCRLFLVNSNHDLVTPQNSLVPAVGTGEGYSNAESYAPSTSGFVTVTLSAPDTLQAACVAGPRRVPSPSANSNGQAEATAGQVVALRVGGVDIQTPPADS